VNQSQEYSAEDLLVEWFSIVDRSQSTRASLLCGNHLNTSSHSRHSKQIGQGTFKMSNTLPLFVAEALEKVDRSSSNSQDSEDLDSTEVDDLFALGTVIYEICVGHQL
jgi:hypothetical protein